MDKIIAKTIAHSGIISLDLYLSVILQHYYSLKSPIGKQGDFITSPEISQIFGITICGWIYEIWQRTLRRIKHLGKKIILIELGPGHGTLMKDIIDFATQDEEFFASIVRIVFVENSNKMRRAQSAKLQGYMDFEVIWYDSIYDLETRLSEFNFDFQPMIIANEFFDAMPTKQFTAAGDGTFEEIFVGKHNDSDEFSFTKHRHAAISKENMESIMQYSNCEPTDFNKDDIYEISTVNLSGMTTIGKILQERGGGCIIIDYGYDIPPQKSTIKVVHKHKISDDIFHNPGESDISLNVDFGAMKNLILRNFKDLTVTYGTQKDFMHRYHGEIVLERMLELSPDEETSENIKSAFKKLTDPDQMGEIFKVMIVEGEAPDRGRRY